MPVFARVNRNAERVRRVLPPRNPGNLEDVAQSSARVILPIWTADYPRRKERAAGVTGSIAKL